MKSPLISAATTQDKTYTKQAPKEFEHVIELYEGIKICFYYIFSTAL